MCERRGAVILTARSGLAFPDPRQAEDDGLLAIGGDLRVERLLHAYDNGIFPWYGVGLPVLWWSPNPRAVIEPSRLHISRSMRRFLRRGQFELTWNAAFGQVIRECAEGRSGGTWILPEMIAAYLRLHWLGHAHSLEVWMAGQLAGGLYGVQRGGLFAAESMFYRQPNASKVAVIGAVRWLSDQGICLFDVQFLTPHLASLGATEMPRDTYLKRLHVARSLPVDLRGLRPTLAV